MKNSYSKKYCGLVIESTEKLDSNLLQLIGEVKIQNNQNQ